jgi:hypothetical protein
LLGQKQGGLAQQHLYHPAGAWHLESIVPERGPPDGVTIECFPEQSLLVAESGVETGRVDAHCLGELGNGRSLVPVTLENAQSPVKSRIQVKFAGATRLQSIILLPFLLITM